MHGIDVDTSFQATVPNGTVHAIAPTPDGSIWIGGEFEQVNGQTVRSLARLKDTGALDKAGALSVSGPVFSVVLDHGGNVVAGGAFGVAFQSGTVQANGRVLALAADESGNIVAAGNFWSQPDVFVARLGTTGAVDARFKSGLKMNFSLEAGVNVVSAQADGKLLVGGNFDTGAGFNVLARLNTDGSVDASFRSDYGPILYPKALVLLPDGKILVGGTADSSGRGFVRRLNSDGSIDPTFHEAALDGSAEAIAVDANGRVIVGGAFTQVNGAEHAHIARLNPDGTEDARWSLGANNLVKAIAVAGDAVWVGGAFSEIGGVQLSGMAKLREGSEFAAAAEAHLSLGGEEGRNYLIETSTDLVTWKRYGQQPAGESGLSIRTSTAAGPKLFFRARPVD